MTYTWETYNNIYKSIFGVKPGVYGVSALGSYRGMVRNIEMNYNTDMQMIEKLNKMIMPYYEDIKADPNKTLMPNK